jgi:hypothetical protein
MRTERERSVLCTRARGEGLHHSAHRLNPRCICCCGSTEAGFLQALVAPAAVVDKSEERTRLASRTFLVSLISPAARSESVLTLLDCTFRANLHLRAMGSRYFWSSLGLINRDIWLILAPQKKFTARHLPETLLSKYSPSDRH